MENHAVVTVDTAGTIRYWSEGAELLFGYPSAEVLGKNLDLIIPNRISKAHWYGFTSATAEPGITDRASDIHVLCADGQVRTFAGKLIVLTDGLHRVVGATAVFTGDGITGDNPIH